MPVDEQQRADGVFEGGGVKGIAFAGAIASAEQEAGVREWGFIDGGVLTHTRGCVRVVGVDFGVAAPPWRRPTKPTRPRSFWEMAIYLDSNVIFPWHTFAELDRIAVSIVARQERQLVRDGDDQS